MEDFSIKPEAGFGASAGLRGDIAFRLRLENFYHFEARDRHGNLRWSEDIANLIPDAGANDLLTQYLKGAAYTAAWFVGLIDNTGFTSLQNSDTAAKITTTTPTGGTNSWQENTGYSNANRVTATFGTAAARSISNSASAAVFNINATVVITGGFLASSNVKGGTAGVLYGEGQLSQNRSLFSGDTLTLTVTATA